MISCNRRDKSASRWAISEDDLPDAEIIRRAPLLEGLENNPVYRLIVWRRRIVPQRWRKVLHLVVVDAILIGGVLYLFGSDEMAQWGISPPIVMGWISGIIYDIWPSGFGWHRGRNQFHFFDLSRVYVEHLWEAGADPSEIALGVWGSGCPSRSSLKRMRIIWCALALSGSILMFFNSIPLLVGLIVRVIVWGTAFNIVIVKYEPAWTLSCRYYDVTRWKGRFINRFEHSALVCWIMIPLDYVLIRLLMGIPYMRYVEFLFWMAGGLLGARVAGKFVLAGQRENFEGLIRDARRMLWRIQEERDPDPAWKL